MKSYEIRKKYLDFFEKKGHKVIPSASLVPENDPTVLFTTAGMHPLVPYLLGEKHPEGKRLCDSQKCIRTGDIDDVGDNRHLTFFEMLGNWSLGDYFKKETIAWSFEFLTSKEWLNLDPRRLYITVFAGENDVAIDEESIEAWREQFKSVGISAKVSKTGRWDNENVRIFALGKDDNWWGLATGGPCGPCTEMFYDTNPDVGFELKSFQQIINDFRFIEIWNDVFMQFNKKPDGSLEKLDRPNVDTGMGLERTLVVLNGKKNVYETDLFLPLLEILPPNLEDHKKRIIVDHARAIAFLISDGVRPSNKDRGYVLRRLIRRIVTYEFLIKADFFKELFRKISDDYGFYEIKWNVIYPVFEEEKNKFMETLEVGIKESLKLKDIRAKEAFYLFQSFGLPFDIIKELSPDKTKNLNKEDFEAELRKHQDLSRTASAGMFKGGLADNSEATTKLHTVAHLMLAGLRKVLGLEVSQKGSNITAERLRFDFSYKEKMTTDQIKQVADFVNEVIQKDLPVHFEEMTLEKAREINATGVFEHKYGEKVKVYFVGHNEQNISCEICGGPHVERTGVLGKFKIIKEESSSAGVRRIKAVLE